MLVDEETSGATAMPIDGLSDGSVRPRTGGVTMPHPAESENVVVDIGGPSGDQPNDNNLAEKLQKILQAVTNITANKANQPQPQPQQNQPQPGQQPQPQPQPYQPQPRQNLQNYLPKMKAPTFDGTSSWTDYLIQFEMMARTNQWDDNTKALCLAMNLRGAAQSVLGDLDEFSRYHFPSLVHAINQRFAPQNQSEMFWVMLNNRTKKPDESLPEFAHEVRNLVKLAHPNAPLRTVEELARRHFVDALPDENMQLHIVHSQAQTLDDAVQIAIKTDAFKEARKIKGSNKPVRAVHFTENIKEKDQPKSDDNSEFRQMFHDLCDKVHNLQVQQEKTSMRSSPSKSFWTKSNNGLCFICGEKGHFKMYCPYKEHPRPNSGSYSQSGN